MRTIFLAVIGLLVLLIALFIAYVLLTYSDRFSALDFVGLWVTLACAAVGSAALLTASLKRARA